MRIIFLNAWKSTLKTELSQFIKQNLSTADIFCFQEGSGVGDIMTELTNDRQIVENQKIISFNKAYRQTTIVKNDITIINSSLLFDKKNNLGIAQILDIKIDNTSLSICNVHGLPQPGHKLDTPNRIKQSEGIIKALSAIENPVIIGGDFNLLPDTESIKMFEANGYRNLIKDFKIKTTRNSYVWDRFPGEKQLFADYTFVSKNISVKQFLVPNIDISDHLPMILDIKL